MHKSFSNSSNFLLNPGLNGSFTKDFTDDNLDLVFVVSNGGNTVQEISFARAYSVAMTTTMSVADNAIDTKGVYPNPACDMLHVPDELYDSSVEIFNIKLVYSDNKLGSTINVSQLPRGMYIMKFERNSKQFTQKVVIE